MYSLNFSRGLIIVYPYGSYIRNREKDIIVKTKIISTIINQNLLLIENKQGFGIIQLGLPKKISLEQFDKLFARHLILDTDRKKWWLQYTKLYAYPIIKSRFFKKPLLLDYPPGPQITIKPDNIVIRKVYIGMSGYHYPSMYPKNIKDLLEYYGQRLNSVEINSTFYRFPTKSFINNLRKRHLVYSIKVHQSITHLRQLKNIKQLWDHFYQSLEFLHHKIICFLFQLSPRFLYHQKNFSKLSSLSQILSRKHRYAFEFRHMDWFQNKKVIKLFNENDWTLVMSHVNNQNSWAGNLLDGFNPTPKEYTITSDLAYLRMHGTSGQYTGAYRYRELQTVVDFITKNSVKYACIYFNNTDSNTDALVNAISLGQKFNDLNKKI